MRRSWSASQPEEVAHQLGKATHADRLLDVPVEPGLESPPSVVVHGERSHRDHRDLAVLGLSDLPERLGSVDARELQIHQDEVGALLVRQPHAVLPRRRLDHLIAGVGQYVPHQLQVLRVVLDHQDAVVAHRHLASGPVPVCAATGTPTAASAVSSSSRRTGLTRYAAAPNAAPRALSSTIDTTITGMSRVVSSALSAFSTAQPSMPGSRMSSRTASGCVRRIAARPDWPSRAVVTLRAAPDR